MVEVEFSGKPARSRGEIRQVLKQIHKEVESPVAGPFANGFPAQFRKEIRAEVDRALENGGELLFSESPYDQFQRRTSDERQMVNHAILVGGVCGLFLGLVLAIAFTSINALPLLPATTAGIIPATTAVCIWIAVRRALRNTRRDIWQDDPRP